MLVAVAVAARDLEGAVDAPHQRMLIDLSGR